MQVFSTLAQIQIKEPTAVALGYFDGVHLGHQAVIQAAAAYKSQGLRLCVFTFVANRVFTGSGKGKSSIITTAEKIRLCKELGADIVVIPDFTAFKDNSPQEFIRHILLDKLRAAKVSCGEDFHFGKNSAGDVSTLVDAGAQFGFQVEVVYPVRKAHHTISSTRIRHLMALGEMADVAALLGRIYSINLPVEKVEGSSPGQTKITQYFAQNQLVPRPGAYASAVAMGDQFVPASTQIIKEETGLAESPWICQTQFAGDGDLAEQTIRVGLIQFLPDQAVATITQKAMAVATNRLTDPLWM